MNYRTATEIEEGLRNMNFENFFFSIKMVDMSLLGVKVVMVLYLVIWKLSVVVEKV